MTNVDYNIIAFDAQYFLYRNFAALKGRTKYDWVTFLEPGEGDTSMGYTITAHNFDEHDLVKQFFWTIAKVVREVSTCNKIILLWDKGPYHKTAMLPDYKGTRVHPNQSMLDDMDPSDDPTAYLQLKEGIRLEEIKAKAKYWIINNLDKLGMPSIIYDGYEADDLACIFTDLVGDEKCAICSTDNDWMYWISDKVDYISFNKSEVWTLDDVKAECEGMTDKLGIDIFKLKQYMDSTFYSHNDLKKTSTLGWANFEQLYTEIQNEDYTHITDVDRLKLNLRSFEWWNYPEIEDVKRLMTEIINFKTDTLNLDTYYELRAKGFQVSQSYFQNYLTTINPESYAL